MQFTSAQHIQKYFLAIYSVLLFLTLVTTPNQSQATDPEKTKVGVILPFSGPAASYGEKIKKGLLSAVAPNIELLFEDEACEPKKAVNAYRKLTDKLGINIFLGPGCGTPQVAVGQIMKNKDQVAILTNSAPASIFERSGKKMFGSQHSIGDESKFLAEVMNSKNFDKVTPVFFESDFGRSHEKSFRKNYKGQITESLTFTTQDATESISNALRIKQLSPSALYIPDGFTILLGFTKELDKLGLINIPIYTIWPAQADEIKNVLNNNRENLFYSYPDIGNQDALFYYPQKAVTLLSTAVKECSNSKDVSLPTCIRQMLKSDKEIGEFGYPKERFVLKKLVKGVFVGE